MLNYFKNLKLRLNNFFNVTLGFLFLIQTLILPLSTDQSVLCISEDHIAVEKTEQNTTCKHDTTSLTYLREKFQKYHQDDCADIPLMQHEKNIVKITKHLRIAVQPLHLIGHESYSSRKSLLTDNPQSHFNPPTFSILKSTILLI